MDTAPQEPVIAPPLIAPDIRAMALVIISARLRGTPELATPLIEFGVIAVVDILIALEAEFGIPLDVDEAIGLTVAALLIVVQRRAMIGPRFTPQPSNCRLYDFDAFVRGRRTDAAERCRLMAEAEAMARRNELHLASNDVPADPPPIQSSYATGQLIAACATAPCPRACHARSLPSVLARLALLAFLAGLFAALPFYLAERAHGTRVEFTPWSLLH